VIAFLRRASGLVFLGILLSLGSFAYVGLYALSWACAAAGAP
jgi:hypothetical protein